MYMADFPVGLHAAELSIDEAEVVVAVSTV